MWYIYTME
jgi:hypothetical protein